MTVATTAMIQEPGRGRAADRDVLNLERFLARFTMPAFIVEAGLELRGANQRGMRLLGDDMDLDSKEARLLEAATAENMDRIWEKLDLQGGAARDDMTCLTVVREP